MKLQKEGLNIYCVKEQVNNMYFLSVEYQVLRHNQPEAIVPMYLREKDGNRMLLYDITGAKKLVTAAEEGKGFSAQDCRSILQSLLSLLHEIEELMLEPEHISFAPEYVYQGIEGQFRWMYLPDETYDVEKEAEEFFSWMLSEVNYEEQEAVRFVYHVYWCVRNKGFSENMIKECLEKRESIFQESEKKVIGEKEIFEEKDYHEKRTREDNLFQNSSCLNEPQKESFYEKITDKKILNEEKTDNKISVLANGDKIYKSFEPDIYGKSGKGTDEYQENSILEINCKKKKIYFALEILGMFFLVGDICSFVLFFAAGMQQNFPMACKRFLIGFSILFFILLDGIYQLHQKKKSFVKEKEDIPNQVYVGNYAWEEEQGTILLNTQNEVLHPVLKCSETGEIHFIKTFPFYIGSDGARNQLVLKDKTVSRQHAVFLQGKETGSYLLQDLCSTNGTWVNHKRLNRESVELKDRTVIRFAEQEYIFLLT